MPPQTAPMLVVTVPIEEVDVAADRLWRLGVRAIEERTSGDPRADGLVELWTAVGDRAACRRARDDIGARWTAEVVEVDVVPADTWREHAEPLRIAAQLVVAPAWHDIDVGSDSDVTVVAIEPGGAFGLGDHPTTQLCLRWIESHGAVAVTGGRVLDIGCGTGVLSVVAARRGASSVRAVDVAPAAVTATADNARRNGVDVTVDDTPAQLLDGEYDVVFANILAPELIALAGDLRRLTASDGVLLVSGILAGAHGHVLDALQPMVAERTDELEGWAAVTLRHR